jgi:hypothetical protein
VSPNAVGAGSLMHQNQKSLGRFTLRLPETSGGGTRAYGLTRNGLLLFAAGACGRTWPLSDVRRSLIWRRSWEHNGHAAAGGMIELTSNLSKLHVIARELIERRATHQLHSALDFLTHKAKSAFHAGLTSRRERKQIIAANADSFCAKRKRL